MAVCKECENFHPIREAPEEGDCILRASDARQSYYTARPAKADQDATECSSFQQK